MQNIEKWGRQQNLDCDVMGVEWGLERGGSREASSKPPNLAGGQEERQHSD